MRKTLLLRVLLAIVDTGWWLAPPSRRKEWRRQWRADILHEWQWRARHPRGVGDRSAGRQGRGRLRHAFWLRLHVRSLEMITQDIRYGWRLMVRKPAFTAVAVLTLGLGIGANVTMFSWTQIMLRRQIRGVDRRPSGRAERHDALPDDLSVSYPDFLDLREQRPDSVEDIIAFTLAPMSLRTNGGDPQRAFGQLVSGNYFDALGVRPALGRAFLPEEDTTPNGHPVVVFSHKFWQRRFGGDLPSSGEPVTLNGLAFTVIGIAPTDSTARNLI